MEFPLSYVIGQASTDEYPNSNNGLECFAEFNDEVKLEEI